MSNMPIVSQVDAAGPLDGVRCVELASVGPVGVATMLLADLGADVIRIDRPTDVDRGVAHDPRFEVAARGKRSITLDLKAAEDLETALRLVERADIVVEGFRPGVSERIGIGPEACLGRNPALVYGRMTGWGQAGPLAQAAGHDINYMALAGPLHHIGRAGQPPTPPLNLVGDMGGGAMLLAFGVLAALTHSRETGNGQVVDAAMVDGAALLMTPFFGLRAMGAYNGRRGENSVDTGAHFYDVYRTKDGEYVTFGALEAQFFDRFCELTGFEPEPGEDRYDPGVWARSKPRVAALFLTKTRAQWCELLEGTDACFAPVLSMDEAPLHPHNVARETYVEAFGLVQPGPAPRFSLGERTIRRPPPVPGEHTGELLREWLGMDTPVHTRRQRPHENRPTEGAARR